MSAEDSRNKDDLLRQMGQAAGDGHWSEVLALADEVLEVDAGNGDALSYRLVAKKQLAATADGSPGSTPETSQPTQSIQTGTATTPEVEEDSSPQAHVSATGALLVGRDHRPLRCTLYCQRLSHGVRRIGAGQDDQVVSKDSGRKCCLDPRLTQAPTHCVPRRHSIPTCLAVKAIASDPNLL